jgi:GT2 family glycosyltransferase
MNQNQEKLTRVEIVAPVYNRCDITLQCLKSLSRLNKSGLDVHVIIVDDGSSDGTSEAIAREFPDVEVIHGDGSLWFTGGTNRGIEAALKHNPDYILTMNDDSVFDSEFLLRMIETATKYEKSIVGCLLCLWDEPHKIFQVSPRWETLSGGWRHWYQQTVWSVPNQPWEVDLIVGNCILFPAEAIRTFGLMDEKRFPHYGDSEYTPRMRKNGWRLIIEPKARIFCQPNNLPPSVRKMSLSKKLETLVFDLGNAHSLRRRLYGNICGAPNAFSGILAFFVFYLRLLLGNNIESPHWLKKDIEPPLSETFSHRILS